MVIETDRLIVKRTFEDCLNAQEELRTTLEELINENRPLRPEERSIYIKQLSRATLGLGAEDEIYISIYPMKAPECFGSIERFARDIIYWKDTVIKFVSSNDETVEYPISYFWKEILSELFSIFPIALDRSSAMSKEFENVGGGSGYEFNPEGN